MKNRSLILILALSALPASALGPSSEQHSHAAPGRLVDVGGFRLHLNCMGKGYPTVILESGARDFSFDWSLVQPALARETQVCAYDRAGYAWSDAGPFPRTMHQNVAELHALLARARVKPQYVLVGHSLGGLMARVYAAEYPEQVAGMVLIEATHEDNQIMLNGKMMPLRSLSRARSVPPPRLRIVPSDSEGSGSTTLPPVPAHVEAPYDRLPPEIQELHLWALSQPKLVAAASEFDYLPEEVDQIHAERLHHAVPLESKPLIVLTRNGASGDHASQQIDLLKLSRNSRQIIAATNDHHIQLTDPEAVVTAIHDVVESVRHHSLLGPRN